MSLGVLNNIAAIYAQNNLNKTQNSLQNTLTQLSSGSRINSGADDAAGLAIADGLHANVAALTQSSQNASDGIGLLQTADGALSQVTNLLNRAVTLATEAANGTLNTNQTSSANQEYQNILSEVGNIGATTNFNSSGVFTNTAKRIFVSDGTAGGANSFNNVVGALSTASVGVTAPVGATATITGTSPTTSSATATQSSGTVTFAGATNTASGTLSLGIGSTPAAQHAITIAAGTSLTALAAQINADTTYSAAGISATLSGAVLTLKGPSDGSGSVVVGGSTAITGTAAATALTPTAPSASGAGTASTSTITLGATSNTIAGSLNIAVGAGAAHAITVAAGTTGAALAAQINADTTYSAASVTAAYNSGTGVLTLSGPATASSDLAVTGTSLTQTAVGAAVTPTTPSTAATGKSTSTFTLAGTNDTFGGTLSVAVGSGATHAIAIKAGTSGTDLAAQINADATYAAANVGAAFNATTGVLTLSGPVAASSNLSLTGSSVTGTPGTTAGVDFTAAGISSLSATTATTVLTSVTTAIADVAYQRGIIGANINQLTAASQVASAESENLTSAESSIRSTNYGTATSDLAKFKVLSSTGISALAQANSVQQEITKLLQ